MRIRAVCVVENVLTPFECAFLMHVANDSWSPAPVVDKGASPAPVVDKGAGGGLPVGPVRRVLWHDNYLGIFE
jgi:16S rRNA G527 N7-methylase RsmG